MAGTVTTTETTYTNIKRVKFTWVSSAGGSADGATTASFTGEILRVIQVPDGSTTQPTDLYDITVVDADGLDVLFGNGANISNAANSQVHWRTASLAAIVNTTLTIHVTNAGNAKGGSTIIYLR